MTADTFLRRTVRTSSSSVRVCVCVFYYVIRSCGDEVIKASYEGRTMCVTYCVLFAIMLYSQLCRIKRYAQLGFFSTTHILLLNGNLYFLSAFRGLLRLPYKVCISRIMSFLYKLTKKQQQKLTGIQISVRCLKMPNYACARST
jgi:hypothetical protein